MSKEQTKDMSENSEQEFKQEQGRLNSTVLKIVKKAKKNSRIIPFSMLPGSWGLSGITRKRAEIEYAYSGVNQQIKLAEFDFVNKIIDAQAFNIKILEIALKSKMILDYEYKELIAIAKSKDHEDWKRKILELKYQNKHIDNDVYEKEIATLNKEPWVKVVDLDIDPKNPNAGGSFELDWNEYFVKELIRNGYTGITPEHIVQDWFDTLCRVIGSESVIGESVSDDNQTFVQRKEQGDDKAEYS